MNMETLNSPFYGSDRMTLLENLYYGNLQPAQKTYEGNSHYAKSMKILTDNEEKLVTFLDALPDGTVQRAFFSQMMNAQSELHSFEELDRFLDGFRLGAALMLETFVLPQQSVLRDVK